MRRNLLFPNFRLGAVVIETANSPYFIKLTGPAATIAAHEKSFEQFLNSLGYKQAESRELDQRTTSVTEFETPWALVTVTL